MATTNHERVGKALDLLKAGLGPFIEREFKNTYQDRALAEASRFMGGGPPACRAGRGAGRDPAADSRLTAWEMVHQLIRTLEAGGEGGAAGLVAKLGSRAETARELCYRLYTLCERKKRAQEALSYNGLVQSWPEITRLAREGGKPRAEQVEIPL